MAMKLLDQAKQLMNAQFAAKKKHEASVLGIDIGSSAIKVVQLRNEGGAALLETYGEIALGPFGEIAVGEVPHLQPEVMARALKELMQGAGVTTSTCAVAVPFASSLVKLIEVPSVDPKQMNTVIPIEARKYVPVAITDVQLDWFVIPETEQRLFEGVTQNEESEHAPLEKRMVLIVAMHNALLERHAQVLQINNLSPMFYEIEAFSSIRATIDRSLAPVAVLDLGAVTSKLYVVELGIILASHVVQKGAFDITRALASSTHVTAAKAEMMKRQAGIMTDSSNQEVSQVSHAAVLTMEQVLAEVRRVLVGFQRRYNKVITKVVLSGGGATLKGIQDFARTQLEIEVELAQPFAHVQSPAFLEDMLKTTGPGFAVAAGLAMRALHENE